MLRRTLMALALGLALTACSTDAAHDNSITGTGGPGTTSESELRGLLAVQDDGGTSLIVGGHAIRLVGVNPAVAQQLDGAEVLVVGRMDGEAFLVAMIRAVADQPDDPGVPVDPTVRMP